MMLHEAVMLEIYRQALSASELPNPRSPSRETNTPSTSEEVRCISNNSFACDNENVLPVKLPVRAVPGVLGFQPTITTPADIILPTQGAAMAAYLNTASAAQRNQLYVANPLTSLEHQSAQLETVPTNFTMDTPMFLLDLIQNNRRSRNHCEDEDVKVNFNASVYPFTRNDGDCPLDLSVSSCNKRQSNENVPKPNKTARRNEYNPVSFDNWEPPMNAYFSAMATNLSPEIATSFDWSMRTNGASSALLKMKELKKTEASRNIKQAKRFTDKCGLEVNNSLGRQSAVQAHWLDEDSEHVRDILKCVGCTKSFPSLETFTSHIKECQHGGTAITATDTKIPTHKINERELQYSIQVLPSTTESSKNVPTTKLSTAITSKPNFNLLLNENVPLPRKLVRGQDVWLGKGAEQTREILKCMWCGQSFRSLAEMTGHMQETQHYMNIISQEQISSWKSSDCDKSTSGGSSNSTNDSPALTLPTRSSSVAAAQSTNTTQTIIACKVCEEVFSSLKELSCHMAKKSHYTERGNREDSYPQLLQRYRHTREKRKKCLPVRKLLELERAHSESKVSSLDSALKSLPDFDACTKITCEKCETKIETAVFVEHIRQCLVDLGDGPKSFENFNNQPTLLAQTSYRSSEEVYMSPRSSHGERLDKFKKYEGQPSSLPSVLNDLERLIEKSFEARAQQREFLLDVNNKDTKFGKSNLNRLEIDDKTFMEDSSLPYLNSCPKYSLHCRSVSESSSLSEHVSSRIDAHTPASSKELRTKSSPNQKPEVF